MAITAKQQENIDYIMDWFGFQEAVAVIKFLYKEPDDMVVYAGLHIDPDDLEEGEVRAFVRRLLVEVYEENAQQIEQADFRVIRDLETDDIELLFVPVDWGTVMRAEVVPE